MLNSLDDLMYINSFSNVMSFLENISEKIKNLNVRFILLGKLLILNENEEQTIENKFNLLREDNCFYAK